MWQRSTEWTRPTSLVAQWVLQCPAHSDPLGVHGVGADSSTGRTAACSPRRTGQGRRARPGAGDADLAREDRGDGSERYAAKVDARTLPRMDGSRPAGSPVDTKKKESIGNYANAGKQWRKRQDALRVNGHDFPDPSVPRAHPYGIYELTRNWGFVNLGTDHDTATFAVASIRTWWRTEGRRAYPKARRLQITADAGGSNGARLRLWKWELQRLADELR